jgi:hypothetical protein
VALSKQTATINGVFVQNREWLDFIYQVVSLAEGFVPPALALFLLYRYLRPPGSGFGIGFDTSRLKVESLQGVGFAALIGIPGLVVVYTAHRLGLGVNIVASSLPDVWYRIPVLVASALQNATSEEVIVMGYLLTRLAQLGWTRERAIGAAAGAARQLPPLPGLRRVSRQRRDGCDLRMVVHPDSPGVAAAYRAFPSGRGELRRIRLPAQPGQLALDPHLRIHRRYFYRGYG